MLFFILYDTTIFFFLYTVKMSLSCDGMSSVSWWVYFGPTNSFTNYGDSVLLPWMPVFDFRTFRVALTHLRCKTMQKTLGFAVCLPVVPHLRCCVYEVTGTAMLLSEFMHCYLNSIAQGSCTKMLVITSVKYALVLRKFLFPDLNSFNWAQLNPKSMVDNR